MTHDDERSESPISGPLEERSSYDNCHTALARVYSPKTQAELAERLRLLSHPDHARRLTISAGKQSLDGQGLGDRVVVQMGGDELSRIGVPQQDERGHYVTLGAAAAWGDVLPALAAHGLVPYSVVTTSHATVGGTISADCLSRSSPLTGREGVHVRGFKLITVDGRAVECRRDDPDPAAQQLFRAVIGGFGYFGVLTEVTIDLRPPPAGWVEGREIRVATRCDKFRVSDAPGERWADFLPWLRQRAAGRSLTEESPPVLDQILGAMEPADVESLQNVPWDAVSSAAWFAMGEAQVLLFRSRYVLDRPLRPLPIYQHSSKVSELLTLASVSPALSEIGESAMFAVHPAGVYVDALADFTFFMENQIKPARDLAASHGFRLNSIQQTFVLPARATPDDPAGVGPTAAFLDRIRPVLFGDSWLPAMLERMRPTLIDVLYLPADDFMLSATRGLDGFAVTLTFSELDKDGWEPLQERLRALSAVCHELGGRVHLVKDVVAEQPLLEAMYGGAFAELRALKRQYDPLGVLENAFYDRVFGEDR